MPEVRNTIVFLTSDYLDYAKLTAELVSTAAAAAGFGTLCVTGRELESIATEKTEKAVCNAIYRLIENVNVAGIVFESGMLGHHAGAAAVEQFVENFDKPSVSLGLDVAAMPSVIPDDAFSMKKLMDHLLFDVMCQRLAFVRGIQNDVYSLERESIFRNTLALHDREIDESLFVTGNYDVFEAYEAVDGLLRLHDDIDAIVCANDMMALGAARAVTAAGLSIPRDLVVTGFDDVPDATRHSPALTTVRQPLVDMAESAVAKLLLMINDTADSSLSKCQQGNRLTRVSSELIVRGSTVSALQHESSDGHFGAADLQRLLQNGMIGLKAPVDADFHTLSEEIDHTIKFGSMRLSSYLKNIVRHISHSDAHWWSNLCYQIEEVCNYLIAFPEHAERLPYIEAALVCVRERVWALEMEREFAARRQERVRSSMQLRIGSTSGIEECVEVINGWISASSPRRFFLVSYDEPSVAPRKSARVILAYRNGIFEPLQSELFATRNILPEMYANELEHGSLLLNPVYAGSEHFGYLLIDPDGLDVSHIDSAAHSIGNALRSHFLVEALERQALRLQEANTELSSLANRDALTGLPNRLCFDRRLRDMCESSDGDTPFALCFLDLDGFKMVNDVYGHEIGDKLLKCVSERLDLVVSNIVGHHGFVARLGGDEFTVVLHSPELYKDLDILASLLLTRLSERIWLDDIVVQVSASIGAAVFPYNGTDTSTLLKCADAAMYQAKSLGKNRFVRYASDDIDSLQDARLNAGGFDTKAKKFNSSKT